MSRKICVRFFVGAILMALPVTAQAVLYSPSQAELNAVEFVDFINNPEPDNAQLVSKTLVGSDGVKYTFDTDYDIDDSLYRVALENLNFSLDLDALGGDSFNILFSDPVAPEGVNLLAQIFVRSNAGTAFTVTGQAPLVAGQETLLSISRAAIAASTNGDPTNITSFGIEFFGGDEFISTTGFMVTARTAPQINDVRLFSWETPDDPGTPAVDERFEGWTVGFDTTPETMHSIYTDPDPGPGPPGAGDGKGATHGSHALQIERTFTEMTFRWGSEYVLAAGGGGAVQGDYNADSRVDAADYTVWRDNLGSTTANLPNDPTPTVVDQSDYSAWKTNFGQTGGADPIQDQIDEIAGLLEAPDSFSLAFDVTINPQDDPPPPTFLSFEVSISDSDNIEGTADHFYQAAAPFLNQAQVAEILEETTYTMEIPLANFTDRNANSPDFLETLRDAGIYDNSSFLRIGLSSNLDSSLTYQIDNFRIRQIVPGGGGALSIASVPEPATLLMAWSALMGAAVFLRRRGHE